MSDTAIYDPRANLTPHQLAAIERSTAFRRKIAAAAKPDIPVICLSASARVEIPSQPLPVQQFPEETWVDRQKRIHARKDERFAARTEPWFSIIEEIDPSPDRVPTIASIQKACCDFYGVSRSDFLSNARSGALVNARHVGMFLSRDLTRRSFIELGRFFGKRDHSTVLHGVRKIAALCKIDAILAAEIDIIRKTIMERA